MACRDCSRRRNAVRPDATLLHTHRVLALGMFDRARLETPVYAALRIMAGAMFTFHGTQKLFGVLATKAGPAVGSQLWVGGVIELMCGVLIAVGLFTRV